MPALPNFTGTSVDLAVGNYSAEAQINLPNQHGFDLHGSAFGDNAHSAPAFSGAYSALTWHYQGVDSGALLWVNGSNQHISRMNIMKAHTGIYIAPSGGGIDCDNILLESIWFSDGGTGVVVGAADNSAPAIKSIVMDQCFADRCTGILTVQGSGADNIYINDLWLIGGDSSNVDNMITVSGGGNIHIDKGEAIQDFSSIFYFPSGATLNPKHNNYSIRQFKYDEQVEEAQVINMEAPYSVNFTVSDIKMPASSWSDPWAPWITLRGAAKCDISNTQFYRSGLVWHEEATPLTENSIPHFHVHSCIIDDDWQNYFNHEDSTGRCTYIITDCINSDKLNIPNQSGMWPQNQSRDYTFITSGVDTNTHGYFYGGSFITP